MPSSPSLKLVAPGADDPIAALLAERERVAAEYGRLAAISNERAQAENVLSAADAALKALDEVEAIAWRAFAANPHENRPTPRAGERRTLADKRAEAAAALDAARVAEAAIMPKLQELQARLADAAFQIFQANLAAAVADAQATHAEAVEIAARLVQPLIRINSFRAHCFAEAGRANSAGEQRRAHALAAAAETVAKLAPPDVKHDAALFARELAAWRERLA